MQVSVPIEKLPNIGVHKTSFELATKRLAEISTLKMRESGLVNSVFTRGFSFSTDGDVSDATISLLKILKKYVEATFPWAPYARCGFVNAGTHSITGISVPFQFKERNGIFSSLTGSTVDRDCSVSSVSGVRTYGIPTWVTRYVARLNREILKARLPLWISLSCTNYSIDDYEYLAPAEDGSKTVLVKVVFHLNFLAWKVTTENFQHLQSTFGGFGKNRHPECVQSAFFVEAHLIPESLNSQMDSVSPYMVFFHLEAFKQVLKSLYRKVDYVPTVYSVTPV
jgi:hypothetical protein